MDGKLGFPPRSFLMQNGKTNDGAFGVITASLGLLAHVLAGFARKAIITLAVNPRDKTAHILVGPQKGQGAGGKIEIRQKDLAYITYAALDRDGNLLVEADARIGTATLIALAGALRAYLQAKINKHSDAKMADLVCYDGGADTRATIFTRNGEVRDLPDAYRSYRMTSTGGAIITVLENTMLYTMDPDCKQWAELTTLDHPILSLDRVRTDRDGNMFVIANSEDGVTFTRVEFTVNEQGLEANESTAAPLTFSDEFQPTSVLTTSDGVYAVGFVGTEGGAEMSYHTAAQTAKDATATFLGLTTDPEDGDRAKTTDTASTTTGAATAG